LGEWIASGRAVDAILLLVLLEAGALAVYHRLTGRGPAAALVLPALLAGAALLLALRLALADAAPLWLALSLLAALFAHLFDLASRWRQRPR
jgi:hypothetical protein